MRSLLYAVMFAAACGNVAKAPDARIDSPSPDAFSCPSTQLECSENTCTDVQTEHDHCGACDIACAAAADCVSGHCADATADCFTIHQFNSSAMSGLYEHKLDHVKFFCDFAHMMQYDELDFGQYNTAHAGLTLVSVTDMQDATIQQAFIELYNLQGGAKLNTSWTSSNCCFKFDAGANELFFGGRFLIPLTAANAVACSPAGGYVDPIYRFELTDNTNITAEPPPLPSTFFTTNPVTGATDQCMDNNNPAFYWKRHAI